MVLAIAMAALLAAVGYSVAKGKVYRAYGSVTVPAPASLQGQQADAAQYRDSQVLLLESQGVAQRAASSANRELGGNMLTAGNFIGATGKLVIAPPVTATPGGYGASITVLSFSWPDARVAQAGVNAMLQAFDDASSAATTAQANATIAGIDQALAQDQRLAGAEDPAGGAGTGSGQRADRAGGPPDARMGYHAVGSQHVEKDPAGWPGGGIGWCWGVPWPICGPAAGAACRPGRAGGDLRCAANRRNPGLRLRGVSATVTAAQL